MRRNGRDGGRVFTAWHWAPRIPMRFFAMSTEIGEESATQPRTSPDRDWLQTCDAVGSCCKLADPKMTIEPGVAALDKSEIPSRPLAPKDCASRDRAKSGLAQSAAEVGISVPGNARDSPPEGLGDRRSDSPDQYTPC